MSAICGWNATLIAFLFSIPGTFVEWPQAYFLFEQSLATYDLLAIGMIILIFIYLRFRIFKKTWELVVLAILAQLTLEYMGLVFFSAIFVQTYYQAGSTSVISRLLEAAKKSAVIGVTVICIACLSYIIFFSIGNELTQVVPGISAVAANLESFSHAKWWIIIMISMLVPSVLVGACIGLAYALTPGKLMARDIGADLTILGGILMGFSLVLAIGVFTAYYPSELGRQMLPISITTLLFSIRIAEYFATAWFRD